MDFIQKFQMLNPVLKVHWAGWESDTLTLQRAGWQFSANQDVSRGLMRFAIKHEGLRMQGVSDVVHDVGFRRYSQESGQHSIGRLNILRMVEEFKVCTMPLPSLAFEPISMEPAVNFDVALHSLDDLKIFAPIKRPEHSIIIDPNSTQELLNRVLELQDPKQIEIRAARNKEIRKFFRESASVPREISPKNFAFAEILVKK